MIVHPELKILVITEASEEGAQNWRFITDGMDHVRVDVETESPADLNGYQAVITIDASGCTIDSARLMSFVESGGTWLALAAGQARPLPKEFGVQPGPVGPVTELRVLFTRRDNPLGARLPDAVYVGGTYQPLVVESDDIETVLYVDYHYQHSSVLTLRSHGAGHLACTTLQDFSPPLVQRAFYRLLRQCQGLAPPPERSLGIGILGYAPSVGKLHGIASEHTQGLHLVAACDLDPRRLYQAKTDFPAISVYTDAAEMAAAVLVPACPTPAVVGGEHVQVVGVMQSWGVVKPIVDDDPFKVCRPLKINLPPRIRFQPAMECILAVFHAVDCAG
jgi:hypothetical protein